MRPGNRKMVRMLSLGAALATMAPGCGDNLGGAGTDILLRPPAELRALSVDSTHVRLDWTPSPSAAERDFAGYLITHGANTDTAGPATLRYTVGSLPPGPSTFTVRSRRANGQSSSPLSVTWAPASRFDDGSLVIYELDVARPGRAVAIDVGTTTTDPSVLVLDPLFRTKVDFFLQGPAGQPLVLRSPDQYLPSWNVTRFSNETTTSVSLDTSRTAFPAEGTFVLSNVPVADNTVYYARVQGDLGVVHYVRIHVRVTPGTSFPDRTVVIRLSLQRVPGTPLAAMRGGEDTLPLPAGRAQS